MRFVTLFLAALSLHGQPSIPSILSTPSFCVTAYPQPLKASALMLGTSRDYGVWSLYVTGNSGPVSRRDIVTRLPFSPLMQWQVVDLLTRKADTSFWGTVKAYFGVVKDLASAGLAFASARTSSNPTAQIVMAAAAVLIAVAGGRVASRAPNPTATEAHLLPDAGVPGEWEGLMVTGIIHGASKVGPICQFREGVQ